MDTDVRECIICEQEGDCIEGICSECAENPLLDRIQKLRKDFAHELDMASQANVCCVKLQTDNKRLREALDDIAEKLDEDHTHNREDCTGDCPMCRIEQVLGE